MIIVSNPTLDLATARARIASQQSSFRKARGQRALAEIVVEGYLLIKDIIANLSADEQLAIFDEHGVKFVESASVYGQWIKIIFGEPHLDPSQTFTDGKGVERIVWVQDRSMEVYHHTMEDLAHFGVTSNHVDHILDKGGALAMAKARKRRLAGNKKPGAEAVTQTRRQLFLAETPRFHVATTLPIPEGAADFVTVVCRVVEGGLDLISVVNKDAGSIVNKLAADRYDDLAKARNEREQAAKIKAEAERQAEERMASKLGGMNKEERLAFISQVAGRVFAKSPDANSGSAQNG